MGLPQHFLKDCRAIFTGRNLKFHVKKPFENCGAVFLVSRKRGGVRSYNNDGKGLSGLFPAFFPYTPHIPQKKVGAR
jgi:hypothetical protein